MNEGRAEVARHLGEFFGLVGAVPVAAGRYALVAVGAPLLCFVFSLLARAGHEQAGWRLLEKFFHGEGT
jgi:hypothetical protein